MKTVTMKIADLQAHPQQQIYGDLSPIEFQELKKNLDDIGQRQPVEVDGDGTIIDGHQRVRALEELGHTEVEVIVRDDLSDDERDDLFLCANLLRRQLDPVAKARILLEIGRRKAERSGYSSNLTQRTKFREWLAERIGTNISGRTVGRYLQLLRLPREVQDAVSSGQLPMTLALKVEALDREDQQAVVDQIEAGVIPRFVVDRALAAATLPDEEEQEELEDDDELAVDDDSPQSWYQYFVERLGEQVPEFEADPHALIGTAGDHRQSAEILASAAEFFVRMSALEREAAEAAELDVAS